MVYENLKLVNVVILGDIYLICILKNGVMSDNCRIIINECLVVMVDWFLVNDEKYINWEVIGDVYLYLFFIVDLNKVERIKVIFEEEVLE